METRTFGQEVCEYIMTLVPFWRVSTEAWKLSDDNYLVGIGVLRNFGGDLMVATLGSADEDDAEQLRLIASGKLTLRCGSIDNIVVVYDHRNGLRAENFALGDLYPIVAWSSAAELQTYVIRDKA
ncbi:MAG TPA: hypothetical protein VIG32_04715 [Candidatus Baltobacteraceae bacterium]|jgi:hypothetical protein